MKRTLKEWRELCTVTHCRWCGRKLPKTVQYYPHPHGWEVEGMEGPQWLYLHCKRCGYDHALWKLGVEGGGHSKPQAEGIPQMREENRKN